MGRPPRDQGPSAGTRLEAAFFDELAKTPFQRVTISAIVRSAGLNRNSFYYHFTDLDDLARSAVAHLLNSEIPRLIASGLALDSERFDSALATTFQSDNITRALAVIGPNSTTELRDALKAAVIDLWLDAFRLRRSDLTEHETATMHFVLAGSLELLTKAATPGPADLGGAPQTLERIRNLRGLPVVQASGRIMSETLGAAAARRGA